MQISQLGHYRAQWGEGVRCVGDYLYYVDIEGKALISYHLKRDKESVLSVSFTPSALFPLSAGGFICAGNKGLYAWSGGKEAPVWLLDVEKAFPQNRLNDGRCSPDGSIFVGSIDAQRAPHAGLYRIDRNWRVKKMLSGVCNSNGIAWSPCGQYLYYIDTPTREIREYHYNKRTGEMGEGHVLISLKEMPVSPDGMCVSAEGSLWVALCHGGKVLQISPKRECGNVTGEIISEIILPCREITSCTFGGEARDILYVTSGQAAILSEPEAGCLFAVSGLGVKGLSENVFMGNLLGIGVETRCS